MNSFKKHKTIFIIIIILIPILVFAGLKIHESKKKFDDYDCNDFIDWVDAQELFEAEKSFFKHDKYKLDTDGDGTACEAYKYGTGKTFREQGWSMMP